MVKICSLTSRDIIVNYSVQLFAARINENVDDGDMEGDMIFFDDYDGSDDEIDEVSLCERVYHCKYIIKKSMFF